MKVALLCNSPLGRPTLEFLLDRGLIAGVALPAIEHPAASEIVALADAGSLPVLRVTRVGLAESLVEWLGAVQADVVWVMGFSYLLPPAVLEWPRLGCFNFHPGRLPAYRGPDPIFWQIRRREPTAGLSVHRMDAGYDTGPLVHLEPVEIGPGDTYGMLLGKMARTAAGVAAALVEALAAWPGDLGGAPQDPAAADYQPRPTAADLVIDWAGQTAAEIEALVRAANPYHGGALAFWRGLPIRVGQASIAAADAAAAPGTVALAAAGEELTVRCRDGALRLDVIGAEDGLFSGARFAAVFGLQPGEVFTPPPTGQAARHDGGQ